VESTGVDHMMYVVLSNIKQPMPSVAGKVCESLYSGRVRGVLADSGVIGAHDLR
jgi:hypothetical protein